MVFHEAIKKALQHLELAERFLAEGRELIDKDPVQASEKLYKAAEEAVKAIATALNLDEARKVLEKGRWILSLLDDAIYAISEKLGVKEIMDWWDAAWFLHVEGFHEARLRSIDVVKRLGHVEALVSLAKIVVEKNLKK
ncbi:MAG: PaREP1 family protein [Desulfurococcaceae archaeon]|nr:PaREP1 family protein [Desulfurococcaceae archaeon]